jgi:hypothetical protein
MGIVFAFCNNNVMGQMISEFGCSISDFSFCHFEGDENLYSVSTSIRFSLISRLK